jgi:hypothetical protein
VVENDVGNRNLGAASAAGARAAGPSAATATPLPLDALLDRVRRLVATP